MKKRILFCRQSLLTAAFAAISYSSFAGIPQDLALNRGNFTEKQGGKAKQKTLVVLLKEIHKNYKVDLLYEAKKLPDVKVDFDPAKYRAVDEMLRALLAPLGLDAQVVQPNTYAIVPAPGESAPRTSIPVTPVSKDKKDDILLLMSVPKTGAGNGYTQVADTVRPVRVTGTVTDNSSSDALPGSNVLIKGENRGTQVKADGTFSLDVPVGKTLVFSLIGYDPKEVLVTSATNIAIQLEASNKALNEIVVVGYGAQKKSLVTGAISSVKAEQIATVSSSRIEQALQGRTPGVSVLPASGSPGSGMRVRVRGTGSNGSAEPLYIIDGVRAGGIEYLDPSEIASVEVLKDGASAAIYGAEGANGVVIITTKTGKANSSEINFSMQYGQQSLKNPMKLMNVEQYSTYLTESNTPNRPTPADINGVQTTDWLGKIFETAPLQRYALNLSGGTDKSNYLIGGTVFSQDGVVGGSKAQFDRYTLRINTDYKVRTWLTVGNRFSFSHFTRKGVTEDSEFGGVINNAILIDPITPVVYDGTLPAHAQAALDAGHPLSRDDQGRYYGISNFIKGEISNPIAQMHNTNQQTKQSKIVGNVFGELEPIKGLKLTTRFGIDAAFQRNHSWTPTFWYSAERLNTVSSVSDNNESWFNWQWENFANYSKRIGKHNFTVLAGMSAIKMGYNRLNGSSSGMFAEEDKFGYSDFTPDDVDRIAGQQNYKQLLSYYGRIIYDYNDKYLLNLTLRRDGGSVLPPDNQWGTFPSVSAGWVTSNESFFKEAVPFINYLKVRASWGINGSLSNIGIGQWASVITAQGLRYPDATGNFLVGAEAANIANPALKWEESNHVDIGFDMAMFNNHLNLSVDYYNKTTKDLISPGTAPGFAGFALPFVNSGDVRNKGWEFDVSYRNDDNDFKWEIGGNLATLDNEVTYLNPFVQRLPGTGLGTGYTATFFEVGYPIWYFRGYKTAGIFQDQAEITKYLATTGITGYNPKPGDPIVVDNNGDKTISNADHTYIGSPHPKLIYGGRINMSYKGFDFLMFLQGQAGNDIFMGFNRVDRPTANKPAFFYTNRWTGAGSTNSWFSANTNSEYVYNGDKMIFNGSYARIRQLQLGYSVPKTLLNRASIKSARLYVSLDDFFTFTDYPGMDPEAGSNNANSLGIDRGVYPIPRKVMFGLNVSF
ncbi:TonB-dependent receptor [uncultured Chitinophaga sp.]|uniref:SusC/RagA family TonB-linked outer membrane protein n=1 Tax=uncultured Chitinophaga sp. TaxID=339340 RepID=UPI0025F46965|nr:TonB-dependent receptor [uncultured Chitinophaga sp.]